MILTSYYIVIFIKIEFFCVSWLDSRIRLLERAARHFFLDCSASTMGKKTGPGKRMPKNPRKQKHVFTERYMPWLNTRLAATKGCVPTI